MVKKPETLLKRLKEPRVIHGSMSVLITVVVILLIISVNIAAHYFTDKFSWSFDITQNKVFSLTQDSIDYIKDINKDVEILVLNSKENFASLNDYYKQADNVINEYAKYSDRISVKYIDLEKDPGIKSSYPEEDIDTNSIIVRCGEKYRVFMANDLFNVQQTYTDYRVSSKAEQTMTSAIVNVISDEMVKVAILNGFDEVETNGFKELLVQNNYDVVTRSLLTEEIDEDAKIALICAPKRDYDKESIKKIQDYLYNNGEYGKNLIYFINPLTKPTGNIEAFMNERGIKTGDGRVFESDLTKIFIRGNLYSTIVSYVDSTYTDGLKNKSIPVAVPLSRQLEITDENKVTTLLEFSEKAGIVPDNADENWEVSDSDIKGVMPAMLLSAEKGEGESGKQSSFVVVGSVQAVDQTILSRTSFNNSSYFLNLFNNLSERKDSLNIESKSIGSQEMSINYYHAIIIGIIFALVIPIAVLLIGLAVWLIRRKI